MIIATYTKSRKGSILIGILIIPLFDERYQAYSLVSDAIISQYGGGVISYSDEEATRVGLLSTVPVRYSVRVYRIRPDGSTGMCGGQVLKDPATKKLVLELANCYSP